MICVECDEPVDSSYTQYANGYIKLTDCSNCCKTADKYIEVDNVLLFIDILLLKPQAYKHLVFNVNSNSIKIEDSQSNQFLNKFDSFRNWIKSKQVQRIRILSILFEIYLSWAYQEKNLNLINIINPNSIYHSILLKNVITQYLYFGLKCVLEDLITYKLVDFLVFQLFKWQPKASKSQKFKFNKSYFQNAISSTILISGGMKLFPILMLIWPYDDVTITNTIVAIANFNLIEALRIVTGLPFNITLSIFSIVAVIRFLITRSIIILMLSKNDWSKIKGFTYNEINELSFIIINILHWFKKHFVKEFV